METPLSETVHTSHTGSGQVGTPLSETVHTSHTGSGQVGISPGSGQVGISQGSGQLGMPLSETQSTHLAHVGKTNK